MTTNTETNTETTMQTHQTARREHAVNQLFHDLEPRRQRETAADMRERGERADEIAEDFDRLLARSGPRTCDDPDDDGERCAAADAIGYNGSKECYCRMFRRYALSL